ncbi:amidophosphoribosyltransferase [Liquorilactobacillus mali]|uniref:Amidophosphoribosyltransferase n=1 Tax=Liquorilactobacillus mali KCTC 3596 = DSM 20444 TaxID=1046596 RepID=J1F4D5_9LACO|nr:amidophosphoribosyltransferase [Liquorilactobacillus mali]EJF00731.1 amidophosphoribosyltransferase [Liquorilactobacillus mali KCTC 3596 = DSM 20444]KRN11547.1 amidophosphoribosyltransferase [Liquorilactobacillus mali KCTC 3596 = DSM 20444]MDC7952354.1 amidophosphoribosyltransferase [Liquorilactobacillus mali]MDV7756791.1 amidophosphoribosyltransferase [Liquorilactobacillus mali]QFQ74294.1 amidophosphoribosyltransferase [Liquorilactobacillus mali]
MPYEIKGLNEECGVFGVFGTPEASHLTYFGLHSLQHRGQEGAGIVVSDGEKLQQFRNRGLLAEVFANKENLDKLVGMAAIGHVRYGTSGNNILANVQPFLFHFGDGDVALAHNGNLTNAETIKRELEKDGAIFQSTSDTEILIHLIRQKKHMDFIDALKASLNQVHGGFAFLLLREDSLIAALDPNGFRPLSIGQLANGSYVVASETCALDMVGAKLVRDVQPGELIIIDKDGLHIDRYTDDTQLAICSMEYIYFSRPDSIIHGVTVHNARKKMGRLLARQAPLDVDMVVGVPNSSLSAASGYAEESGLPYEMGLIKNQYIARTFIQPTQELRERGVKMKLSAVRGVVEGKKVAIIDDSIVRGTTSKQIVRLLREAGAKEVHMRIASPPLRFPCFYGIDISTRSELMAANYSVDEMCKEIGADSLEFLTIPNLIKAIDIPDANNAPNGGLCVAYFDGKYPTPLYDYEEGYLKSLKHQHELEVGVK